MTEETHGSRELCVTGAGQAPAARQVRCKLLQEAANVVLIVHQSQKIETCPMISGNRPGSIDFAKRRSGGSGGAELLGAYSTRALGCLCHEQYWMHIAIIPLIDGTRCITRCFPCPQREDVLTCRETST